MWPRLFIIIILLLLLLTQITLGQAECLFSKDGISEPTFKSSEIEYSKWRNKEIYNAVLKDEKYIYIRYWACDHFGLNANYYIPKRIFDDINLKKETLYLAKNILNKHDYQIVENKISTMTTLLGKTIELPHGTYSEFIIAIKAINKKIMINIDYYGN